MLGTFLRYGGSTLGAVEESKIHWVSQWSIYVHTAPLRMLWFWDDGAFHKPILCLIPAEACEEGSGRT